MGILGMEDANGVGFDLIGVAPEADFGIVKLNKL
jgi:hypothetical protein